MLAGHGIEVAVAGDISSVHRYAAIPQAAGAPLPGTSPALAVLHPMKGPATTSASMTSRVPAPAVLGQITITTGSAAVFERIVVQPAIATQPRPLNVPQFTIIQGTAALLDRATTGPNISARSQPLNVPQFTIIQGSAAVFDRATTGPNIASRSRPLAVPQFTIIQGTAALLDRATTGPNISARSQPLNVPQFTIIQGSAAVFDRATTGPNIASRSRPLAVPQFTIIQGTAALFDRATTGPNIASRPLAVPQFTIIQGTAALFDRATTGPNIAARSRPLKVPQFTIIQGTAALFDRRTTVANIAARSQPLAVQQFTIIQGTAAILERGLFDPLPPHATILSIGRGIHLQGTPDDSSGAFLRVNGLDHFVGQDGSFSFTVSTGALTVEIRAPGYLSVNVTSPSGPDLFVDSGAVLRIPELRLVYGDANGDGVINSEDIYLGSRNFSSTTLALALVATQQEPFTGDPIIRSTGVRLQGLDDSAGAFLLVDGQRHFVDPSGSSSFTVDPGPHDIQIRAPGYLPVDIVSPSGSNIVLGSGDVLTIPELTMVYGDANGDGAIDVRDLALGGRNFGETPEELELTPQ